MKTKQRPCLTEEEYQVARGLVMERPDSLADLGIDSKDKLPWVDPERVPGLDMKMKIDVGEGTILSFKDYARFQSSGALIEFLTNPASEYSPNSLSFGNKYVAAWNELNDRVRAFEESPVGARSVVAAQAVAGSVIVTGDSNVAVGSRGIAVGRGNVVAGERGVAVGGEFRGDVFLHDDRPPRVLSQDQAFDRIGVAMKSNLRQLELNIAKARADSSQFFRLTLVFASLGFLVVVAGVGLLLAGQIAAGIVSTISAVIPEVTAALFFRKDKDLRDAIERYHQHGLESQRLLTMIDVAETVVGNKERDQLKREIIWKALVINTAAQQDAAPNGGPSASVTNSGAGEGPPSVS